jgi:autophagy-related protein 18
LYTLENDIDQLNRTFQDSEHTDICIVERLFSSSLVVIVSLLSPRKLRLYHIKKRTEISIHSYTNTILSVRLNRKRLIICLEDQLYIHSLKDDLDVKWVIKNIPANPNGLFALSPLEERCYLAYPASQKSGEVQIFDTIELKNKILIPAHDNPLAALSFNHQGTMLASASEKGTVIRVHSVDDGQCLYEFRRGYARCVDIYSLSFSVDSLFLAASSSTETVHIFKLDQTKDDQSAASMVPNQSGWSSYLGRAIAQSSTYISSQVSDMLHQWRSFATCRLPFKQLKNVCAIKMIDKLPRVLVVSAEGYLYIYDLDMNEGGDCTLVKQHRLEDSESPFYRDSSSHGAPPNSFPNESQSSDKMS